MILPIIAYGDPVLRKVGTEITNEYTLNHGMIYSTASYIINKKGANKLLNISRLLAFNCISILCIQTAKGH